MYLKKGINKINLLAAALLVIIFIVMVWLAQSAARAKARDAKRVKDAQYIQEALGLYFNDNFDYPSVSGKGQAAQPDTAACTPGGAQFKCYLPNYPDYPRPADGLECQSYLGYAYRKLPFSEGGYSFSFCLGRSISGLPAGIHQATASGIK